MARIISEEISTSFYDNIFSCKISSDISFGYHLKRDISRDFVSNETEISQCRLRRDLLISSQLKTLNCLDQYLFSMFEISNKIIKTIILSSRKYISRDDTQSRTRSLSRDDTQTQTREISRDDIDLVDPL